MIILAAAADLEQTVPCYRTPRRDSPRPRDPPRLREPGPGRGGATPPLPGRAEKDGAALPTGTSAGERAPRVKYAQRRPSNAGAAPRHGGGTPARPAAPRSPAGREGAPRRRARAAAPPSGQGDACRRGGRGARSSRLLSAAPSLPATARLRARSSASPLPSCWSFSSQLPEERRV